MITIRNRPYGRDMYIVGDYVVNGCRGFHISEIDRVASIFEVPDELIDEVKSAHSSATSVDWDSASEHEFYEVRAAVAKHGKLLEKLIDDTEWVVRREVALQGYGLEKLVDDKSWLVREAVAEQGYGLEKLADDESWRVQIVVERQGYVHDYHYGFKL